MMTRTASASCWVVTRKHSVKPRPRGSTWTLDCSEVNARGNRSRMAASASRSSTSARSRIRMMTSPPVDVSSRMRAMVRARPTLSTP